MVFSLGAAPTSYQPSLVGKNFSFSRAGLAAKPAALLPEGGSGILREKMGKTHSSLLVQDCNLSRGEG